MFARPLLALLLLIPSAQEGETLVAVQTALAESTTPKARIMALDRAANFVAEARDPDRSEGTKLIAEAMWDRSHLVRMHAVGLVGSGLDETVCIEKLSARCESWPIEQAAAILVLLHPERAVVPPSEGGITLKVPDAESKKKAYEAAGRQLEDLQELRGALLETIKMYRGPEIVRALVDLVGVDPGLDDSGIHEGLVIEGSPEALCALVKFLGPWEKEFEEAEQGLKKAKREKPNRNPSDYHTKEEWKEVEKERIAFLIRLAQSKRDRISREGEALGERIRRLASKLTLSTPPRRMKPVRRWKIWQDKALKKLAKAAAEPEAE